MTAKKLTPQSTSSVLKRDKDGILVLSSYVGSGEDFVGDDAVEAAEKAEADAEKAADAAREETTPAISETAPTPATVPDEYKATVKDDADDSKDADKAPAKKTAAKKTAAKKS